MTRIAVLPPHLSNQIAAGEVVERPASIVKELIENSLDAKATRIEVEIEKGGMQSIRVSDDGVGIHPDDLLLSLERHATSKIRDEQDLFAIQSLGFRGEALASIASISRLSICSRYEASESAWLLSATPHQSPSLLPASRRKGTLVEVRDVFFNVPARRKFLKSESTEFSHIRELIERMALSRPSVAFSLMHQGKSIFKLEPALDELEEKARVAKLVSPAFIENAICIDAKASDMQLGGYLGLPIVSRYQADWQYLFVNGRWIKDKTLSAAIKRGFQDALYQDRHPAFVLFLTLDPSKVDVNAHPAKHEVRFQEARSVFDFIFSQVRAALLSVRPEPTHHQVSMASCEPPPSLASVLPAMRESEALPHPIWQQPREGAAGGEPERVEVRPVFSRSQQTLSLEESILSFDQVVVEERAIPTQSTTEAPLGYALAQLKQTFILAENAQGLVLVDAHAAHERVLYQALKKAYFEGAIPVQALLMPLVLQVSEKEKAVFDCHQTLIESMGIHADWLGPSELAIRSMPALLPSTASLGLLRDLLSDLADNTSSALVKERIEQILGNMACRAAVHANQRLSLVQMNALLREMEKTDLNGQCNHGRPSYRQISFSELDKFFLRGR